MNIGKLSFLIICLFSFNGQAQLGYCTESAISVETIYRNGDGILGETYNKTGCGLDYVQDSRMITTRYTPDPGTGFPCSLNISGIPSSYIVETAYLYWITSYTAGSSTSPVVNLTNPIGTTANYTATLIGEDAPKCWVELGTRGFRADVTAAVAGNGTYTINNIVGNTDWEVDGATLIIIYTDASQTWNGTLRIDDGIISTVAAPNSYTMNSITVCEDDAAAEVFMITSDLQNNAGLTFDVNINGVTAAISKDFYNFIPLTTAVTTSTTSIGYSVSGVGGDCWALLLAGLYTKNTTCATCDSTILVVNTFNSPISCFGVNDANAWVNVNGGFTPYAISWSPGGSTNDTIFNLGPGTYTVTVTDSIGTVTIDSVVITQPNLLTVDINAPNDTICLGTPVNLTSTVNGGTPVYSYQWTTGTSDTLSSNSITPSSSGYVGVTITDDNGCIAVDSVYFTVLVLPLVTSSPDTCLCLGSSATISASGTPTFSWSTGETTSSITVTPTSSTYYYVTYSNGVCSTIDSTYICVSGSPIIGISSIPEICEGTTITLTAMPFGGTAPYSFTWSGIITGTGVSLNATPSSSGTVNLTVVDSVGCSSSTSTVVTVYSIPDVISSKDTCICFGETISINANSTHAVLWNTGETTNSIQISPTSTTTYIVTSVNGICFDDDTTVVCVNPTPIVNVSNDTSIQYQSSVFLQATGTGPFEWSPSNTLSCTPCSNPEAFPLENTTYIVSTTNAFGCSAQDEVTVSIYYVLIIPNIFTPNADGLNDVFYILGLPPESSLTIFNRWGNEMFTTEAYQNNWTTDTDGVYYYVLTTPDEKRYHGFFHVTGN